MNSHRIRSAYPIFLLCFVFLSSSHLLAADPTEVDDREFDVVVYGGTSGGIAAAVQTSRMGKSVLLIEPGKHLGGLTSGGLGATDIGNKQAIGGISREFYQLVNQYYQDESAWQIESSRDFKGREKGDEDAMWFFEPHVAEQIFRDLLKDHKIQVVFGARLDRSAGVHIEEGWIKSIGMESGKSFQGQRFIDATYEGDLMAAAGVSFTVGREANAQYAETLNGVQVKNAIHHQIQPDVDPYVRSGDPSSGLLPNIEPQPPAADGAGDHRVQAYNIRICATDKLENRIPFAKPTGYDEREYELLLRNFEAGERRPPWNPIMMPNRKTDANNNFGVSTDYIGQSYDWAEADYVTREKIYQKHLLYTQGLMYTLATNQRVPQPIREAFNRWGVCQDEFTDNGGWSHQLYVREARRLVSDYVMTQHHCQSRQIAEDPVGLAAYTMDSHHVQRYVDTNGHAQNEGDVQVGGFAPYPISYRSIVPRERECRNLLVPVCLSASHIAYGSIRMEPVFMVLGQSAATAACQSIDQAVAVQRVDNDKLRERLLADKQVLVWTGPRTATGIDPQTLGEVVLDDSQAKQQGVWLTSVSIPKFAGQGYSHDNNEAKGDKSVSYQLKTDKAGKFSVRLMFSSNPNRATNVPVTVEIAGRSTVKLINQRQMPPIDGHSIELLQTEMDAGQQITVIISNRETDGHVIADAVYLVRE